jgi:hypothetical protein
MKMQDVPLKAFTAQATPIPTKLMPDWDALYATLERDGFVVIEEGELRQTAIGSWENTMVKGLNSHIRVIKKMRMFTKRIGHNRWFCTL